MKFLKVELENDTRAKVVLVHEKPELLSQDDLEKGFLVDVVLEPSTVVGKNSIHYINPKTKEQWHEYIDRPLTDQEEIIELKETMASLIAVLAEKGVTP